jgi:hypothetical protein
MNRHDRCLEAVMSKAEDARIRHMVGAKGGPYLFQRVTMDISDWAMLGDCPGVLLFAKETAKEFAIVFVDQVPKLGRWLQTVDKLENGPWQKAVREHGANAVYVHVNDDESSRMAERDDLMTKHNTILPRGWNGV